MQPQANCRQTVLARAVLLYTIPMFVAPNARFSDTDQIVVRGAGGSVSGQVVLQQHEWREDDLYSLTATDREEEHKGTKDA